MPPEQMARQMSEQMSRQLSGQMSGHSSLGMGQEVHQGTLAFYTKQTQNKCNIAIPGGTKRIARQSRGTLKTGYSVKAYACCHR